MSESSCSNECLICLESTEDGFVEHDALFPCDCVLIVHPECLEQWLATNPVCPICKIDFETRMASSLTSELGQPLRTAVTNQARLDNQPSFPLVETVLFVVIVFITIAFFLYPGTRAQL